MEMKDKTDIDMKNRVCRIKMLVVLLTLLPTMTMAQAPVTRMNSSQSSESHHKQNELKKKILNVNRSTSNIIIKLDKTREQWIDVYCNDGNFTISNIPEWCIIADKSKNGFNIRAKSPNSSIENRCDIIKIEGAGKTRLISVIQQGELYAQINKVNDSISDKKLIISIDFGMKKTEDEKDDWRKTYYLTRVDFYDHEGRPLKTDHVGFYRGTNGQVSIKDNILVRNDNDSVKHFHMALSIPIGYITPNVKDIGEYLIKYKVVLYNNINEQEIVSSQLMSTNINIELLINGRNQFVDSSCDYKTDGGIKHFEVKSLSEFSIDSIPDWCSIKNKSQTGFDLYCHPYINDHKDQYEQPTRMGVVVVSSGKSKIKTYIFQNTQWWLDDDIDN